MAGALGLRNAVEVAFSYIHRMEERLEGADFKGKYGRAGERGVRPSDQFYAEVDKDGLLVVLVIHCCASATCSLGWEN